MRCMKNVSAFIVLTAALGMLLFLSFKKEYSCEDCIGNNHPPLAVAGPDAVITLPTKQESSNSNLLVKLQIYPLAFRLLHGFHDFVIGIHPNRMAYYKKIFGFIQTGEEKQYIHLNKAPVALLYLSLKEPTISTRTQVNLAIQLAQQEDLPLRNEELCAAFHHKFFSEFKSFYYQYTGQKE